MVTVKIPLDLSYVAALTLYGVVPSAESQVKFKPEIVTAAPTLYP